MEQENQENTQGEENKGAEQENNQQESQEFDASAFNSESAPKEKSEVVDNAGADNSDDDGDDGFTWDSVDAAKNDDEDKGGDDNISDDTLTDEQKEAKEKEFLAQQEADKKAAAEQGDDGSKGGEEDGSSGSDQFATFAKEMGIAAETKEEFVEQLKELEAENERLRSQSTSTVENDRISRLNELKKKDDDSLLRLDLEKQGLSAEEVDEAMDVYTNNGTVKIEALKIKKQIDRAISNEQNTVIESNKAEEAKLQKQYDDDVAQLSKHIDEEDTKFGFKMAKDEESLKQVRKDHKDYITSGKFHEEIYADSKNLSDAAWLWKNKDTILKALGNKGIQQGRKEILDDIQNPEVSETKRFGTPQGDESFDASAFLTGN
jgi:hypothetical protein